MHPTIWNFAKSAVLSSQNNCSVTKRIAVWLIDSWGIFMVNEKVNKMEMVNMKVDILTPREQEVMKMLMRGYNNLQISEELCVSKHTTKVHLSSIYEKLKVSNRIQAIIQYLKENKNIDL